MRREDTKILTSAACVIALMAGSAWAEDANSRPDVVVITIDDMNDWTTLFDRQHPIQTPNLTRLAARGAFFSKWSPKSTIDASASTATRNWKSARWSSMN